MCAARRAAASSIPDGGSPAPPPLQCGRTGRMRILLLTGWVFLPPFCGTRRVVYNTASGLGAQGHDVLLLAAAAESQPTPVVSCFSFDLVRVNERVLTIYCGLANLLTNLPWLAGAAISDVLRSKILKHSVTGELLRKMASFKPDLVLAEDMYIAPAGLRAARELRVPFGYRIHHIHSCQYSRHLFLKHIVRRWELSVLEQADALIALTPEDKDLVRSAYALHAEYCPIGIRQLSSHRFTRSSLTGRGYILYVSSYLGEELPWLRALGNRFPSATIVFAGHGSEVAGPLPKNIIRLGVVSESELASLYDGCAFVFFPLEWTPGQGFPIKLAEAFRTAKPILLNSRASWLLPPNAAGVFSFSDEEDLHSTVVSLLTGEHQVDRDTTFLDCAFACKQLENKLIALMEKQRDVQL